MHVVDGGVCETALVVYTAHMDGPLQYYLTLLPATERRLSAIPRVL
jgi:hypothetical protein